MVTHTVALKERKKSLIVYLHCPKSLSKLQYHSLMEKNKTNSFESDSDDSPSRFIKSSSLQVSWNENYQDLFEPSTTSLSSRMLCETCNCTYDKDHDIICTRCDTDRMYNESLKTDQSKSNNSLPCNGEDSSNIALISQKGNPELLRGEKSLDLPEGDLTVSNVEHDGNLSLDFLRDTRVDHFQRNSQIPIRARHSIGSPSLLQWGLFENICS